MIEIDFKRFIIVLILIILIWVSFLAYLFYYGEQVRKDPCTVCAESVGKNVNCFVGETGKIFHTNGSIQNIGRVVDFEG